MYSRVSRGVVALVVGGAFLAVPSTVLAAQNVLANSSFEETIDWGEGPKPDQWGFWGLTWSVDAFDPNATLPPIDGERMELVMGPWWCPWCNSGYVQDHAASAGQVWEASCWRYATSAFSMAGTQNFMVMKIEYWDHFDPHPELGETPLAESEVLIADGNTPLDEWEQFQLSSTAPEGTVMARIAFVWIQPNWEIGGLMVDAASFGPQMYLDIKPEDCPNRLTTNVRGKGRLPMAILGTDYLDVNDIDPDTISINGEIFPVKAPAIDGKTAPYTGESCGCHVAGDDGFDDMVLHFSKRDVILGLGLDVLPEGTIVPITVEGMLYDGTPFSATDCVEIVYPSR